MALEENDLDHLIPHRKGMRLIDRVVSVDQRSAITETVPTVHWPLQQHHLVSSLVAVELSAQTAGILIGHEARRIKGTPLSGKGWLVGIKAAVFHHEDFRVGTRVRTRARLKFSYQTFHEIHTEVTVGDELAARIELQIFWTATKGDCAISSM